MAYDLIPLNIIFASIMLLFTSYLDLRKREVPDKIWLISGGMGAALQFYEVENGETALFYLIIAIILATGIGMGIFFLGLYGGADGKALICVAVFLPYFKPRVYLYAIAPLIVLTNGVLLSMLLPFSLLIFNGIRIARGEDIFQGFSEPLYRKIFAAFLGYKSSGKPRDFQFSMEKKENENLGQKKKFDFGFMQDEFETSAGTWVTPGIPLLVFFTAGFFALLLYGDLVISLVKFFSHLL